MIYRYVEKVLFLGFEIPFMRVNNLFGNRQGRKVVPEELESKLIILLTEICRSGEETNATVQKYIYIIYIESAFLIMLFPPDQKTNLRPHR